jgi:hypothetical protein
VVLVRKRTILTERPPHLDEVSANIFAERGCYVVSATDPHGHILFSRPEPLLVLASSSSVVLTRLSALRSRPTTSQKTW